MQHMYIFNGVLQRERESVMEFHLVKIITSHILEVSRCAYQLRSVITISFARYK